MSLIRIPLHTILLTAGVLLVTVLPAVASYSGLTLIPTAETVGANQYAITFEMDGSIPARDVDTYLLNTEFGIGNRVEAGVDFDLSSDADSRVLLSGKYVFANTAAGNRAAAVGITNVSRHLQSSTYLVGSADWGVARTHFGAIRTKGHTRLLAGIDRAVAKRLTASVDYISGDENYSAAGLAYSLTDHTGLFTAILFPNGGGDTVCTLQLCYGGAYRR